MSIKSYQSVSSKKTPQKEPILGREQEMVENSEGGYVFALDKWKQLDRFLILGSAGGTFYVGERELTVENAKIIMECLDEDQHRVVDRIVEISESGRAISNDPALFALAIASSYPNAYVDDHLLMKVARTSTHLFHFLEFAKQFRGWGRSLRDAVSGWYNKQLVHNLAYQVVKYRQRDGWTHMDALRLSHPVPHMPGHDAIYAWVCRDGSEEKETRWINKYNALSATEQEMLSYLTAFEAAQWADSEDRIIKLINDHGLTREMIPTQMRSSDVWAALLKRMPMWAMVRNLGNMGKAGLLVPGNWDAIDRVVSSLRDQEHILKSRMHPLSILIALKTYGSGSGFRSSADWPVVPQVVDALNDAFYLAFGNVEPIGKKIMLALDVSASMGYHIGNYPITCAEGVGALALVTANIEDRYIITAFSAAGDRSFSLSSDSTWNRPWAKMMSQISLSPRERLDDVVKRMDDMTFGGTDCALPMLYAIEKDIDVDAFVVMTDNETWAGDIHPTQALQMYRDKFDKRAKLVVVAMTSTGFSIADPSDPDMLDVVGFDTATPTLVSEFIRGI